MPSYNEHLTAHFIAGELGAERAPSQYHANIYRTAEYLEVIRAALGVPLGKVSGWRSPARNEAVGGSDTSSHLIGLAADFTPLGLNSFTAYNRLRTAKASGHLPNFDQIIYYPFGHLHVGLGSRNRNQFLIRISEKHYAVDTSQPPSGPTLMTGPPLPGQADVTALLAVSFVALVILFAILA